MKKSQFFIALILLLAVSTMTISAACSKKSPSELETVHDADIPLNAVYNWIDGYKSYAGNGEIYVAVGFGGRVDVSRDLQSWNEVKRFTSEDLIYIAYTGKEFVAFTGKLSYADSFPTDHKMNVYVSENGIDWTEQWVDLPYDVTNWHAFSYMEDEFVFIDTNNSCYYMTKDFITWNKVPFCSNTTDIKTHLSIRKINGQYILLDVFLDRPVVTRIYALSPDNKWVEKSSISGVIEVVSDLTYFNGSYYAFSYSEEYINSKTIPRLHVYSSIDMNTWKKASIDVDLENSSIASIHALQVDGKMHLIYTVEAPFADMPADRVKLMEMVSGDGLKWEKYKSAIPAEIYSIYTEDVKFSVFENKTLLAQILGTQLVSKGDNQWSYLNMPRYSTGVKTVYSNNEFFVLQDNIAGTTFITDDGVNMETVESGPISHWTGKEFIVGNKATSDFKEWKDIKKPAELSGFDNNIIYKWADGRYVARVIVNYNNDREYYDTTLRLQEAGYDRKVYIFDSNFKLLGKNVFDSTVRNVEFINNLYFVTLEDGKVFRSANATDWVESSYKEILEQPIYNGGINYLRNNVTDNKVSSISVSSDVKNWNNVAFKDEVPVSCALAGGYYMAQAGSNIYFSKNGIKWIKVAVPHEYSSNGFYTYSTKDYLLVYNSKWLLYFSMKDISAAVDPN